MKDEIYCLFWMNSCDIFCMTRADWASWITAVASLIGLFGILLAGWEITQRNRVERTLKESFVRSYRNQSAVMLRSMKKVPENTESAAWLGIFNESFLAEIARASERPDWVGLRASSLSKMILMQVKFAQRITQDQDAKKDPEFVRAKLSGCVMGISDLLQKLSDEIGPPAHMRKLE